MAEAYRRKYGHEPSARTLWLMGQQAAAMTRRPKSAARKIHGSGGDAGEAERLAAWEAQTAAREITALSRVHADVAAFGSRPVVTIDEDLKAMAARAAVAEVQAHHAVWCLSELRFEVGRALPPGASPELVRQVADLAVTPGSGTGVLLVTAPEVTDVTALGTRKDGTSIYRPPNEARYTTTGHLDLEERILRQARKQVPQRVSEGMARRALTGFGAQRGAGGRRGPPADLRDHGVHPDGSGGRREDAHGGRVRAGLDQADRAAGHRDHHRGERGPADDRRGPGGGVQLRGVPREDQGLGPAALPGPDRRRGRAGPGRVEHDLDRGPGPDHGLRGPGRGAGRPHGGRLPARPGRGGRHVRRADRRAGRGGAVRGHAVRPAVGAGRLGPAAGG